MISVLLLAAAAGETLTDPERLLLRLQMARAVFVECAGVVAKDYAKDTKESVEAIAIASIAKCSVGGVDQTHAAFLNYAKTQSIGPVAAEGAWKSGILPDMLEDARSKAYLSAMDARSAAKPRAKQRTK